MFELQKLLDQAVETTLAQFAARNLRADQLAATLVDLRHPQNLAQASYRGDVQIYPASVIKLFYLVAAHQWMKDKKIEDTSELRRAMRDMIVVSYNEATGYIIDLLTGTTSGPELPPDEIEEWWNKRNAVNRYLARLGFVNINASKKPWCEGPYGRETQAIKLFKPSRNWLTTDATARMMSDVVLGRAVTAGRSAEMMELLKRDPFEVSATPNTQAHDFVGPSLPPGTKLWSKGGWTSETRHDCAYLELPNGARIVLVIFTTDHADDRTIIAAFAKAIIDSDYLAGRP